MKIIIATMSMNSGGAETHVYEMMRELYRKGYELMLISSGGFLSQKLKADCPNIIIKKIKLNKITPFLLISFLKIFKETISFKPNLIHSHGRIPAFICSIISSIFRKPHIVTVHGTYKIFLGSKILSRWGDKTISVSSDIKNYLTTNYDLDSEKIYIQKNGIDTQKFFPLDEDDRQKEKLNVLNSINIYENKKILLNVSRMSKDAYRCADELIETAPAISNSLKDSVLLIVGGGEFLKELRQKASIINRSLQKDFVIVLGNRADIDVLVRVADVFIGNARSAIEAAACGCPIIIAGGGAYMGRIHSSNFDECIYTNFTPRKRNDFDLSAMVNDIITAKRGGFEAVLSEYVRDNYNIHSTVVDLENVYNLAMQEKGSVRCAVFGYFGCGNFGDDLIFELMVQNLRRHIPYLKITVASGKLAPKDINKNIRIINRYNPFSIFCAIIKNKVIILGGGELLQDYTSNRSFIYYFLLLRISNILQKEVILYSNGLGEIKNQKNIKRLKSLNKFPILALMRDNASFISYQSILYKNTNTLHLTADECFSIYNKLNTSKRLGNKKNILFLLKEIENCDCKSLIKAVNIFVNKYKLNPVVAIADFTKDELLGKEIAKSLGDAEIIYAKDREVLLEYLNKSILVLSSRLHGLIFSAINNVAPIAFTNDRKLIEFMDMIEQKDFIINLNDSHTKIISTLETAFEKRIERKDLIIKKCDFYSAISEMNSKLSSKVIKKVYGLKNEDNLL